MIIPVSHRWVNSTSTPIRSVKGALTSLLEGSQFGAV